MPSLTLKIVRGLTDYLKASYIYSLRYPMKGPYAKPMLKRVSRIETRAETQFLFFLGFADRASQYNLSN